MVNISEEEFKKKIKMIDIHTEFKVRVVKDFTKLP